MTAADRISRDVAFLASLVVQKISRVSLDRLEDLGLALLEVGAAGGSMPAARRLAGPSPLRAALIAAHRAATEVAPAATRIAFSATYVGMRAGTLIVGGLSRLLGARR